MKKIQFTNIKFSLTFILVLLSSVCFSQSKKEQIEILNVRIDSLSQLIALEHLTNEEKSNKILELSTKLSSLENNLNTLKNELNKLNSDFEKSNSESISLKQQLINYEKIIIDLQTLMTLKSDSLNTLKVNLKKAAMAQVTNKVTCTEKESKNEEYGDPILAKTCLYKKYKTISKGYPDYKGRYSYEYSVYEQQENGGYLQIKNATLFNENKNELLSIINSKIEKDYKSYSKDPETKDCFEGALFTTFNFDQLAIDFDFDKINFIVNFGLNGACMSVDGTVVSFNLDEIQKYLKE